MDWQYWIGWMGIALGICVPIPQLISLSKNGHTRVAPWTYIFLCLALICYLIHAIYIKSEVFVVAQAINLVTNGTILFILMRLRK